MIRAEGLVKTFTRIEKKNVKTDFNAVDDISLEIRQGEILGVLGPNGAGKTTLLRMLGKLMHPTAGKVVITDEDGSEITDAIEIKRRIGYLSGNTKLYKRLSAREMFMMLGNIYDLPEAETKKRIEEIIEILKLSDFVDNRIERLSTGQTQRISIARALLKDAPILIMDDSVSAVDTRTERIILDNLKKRKGKTTILIAHRITTVEQMDKIVFIDEGKVKAVGSHSELCDICPAYRRMVELQRLEEEERRGEHA